MINPLRSALHEVYIFGMTKRSIKGSKYKNGHISAITYGTRLGVVPMDRYLFSASLTKGSKYTTDSIDRRGVPPSSDGVLVNYIIH